MDNAIARGQIVQTAMVSIIFYMIYKWSFTSQICLSSYELDNDIYKVMLRSFDEFTDKYFDSHGRLIQACRKKINPNLGEQEFLVLGRDKAYDYFA